MGLTHGRVAMLAALGFVVGEQLEDSSAFLLFDGNITGPAIGHYQQLGQGFWEPLLLAIGICESFRVAVAWATPKGNGFNQLKEDYKPGDLGFDPLGLKPDDEQELFELQTKELNNRRLAMIAIAGFVAAELKSPGTEVFQHLFEIVDYDLIKEVALVRTSWAPPRLPCPSSTPTPSPTLVSSRSKLLQATPPAPRHIRQLRLDRFPHFSHCMNSLHV